MSRPAEPDSDSLLRKLIWLYLILLVVEGALRKWILPQYSTPLLLVRDPVLLAIYAVALVKGRFPFNGWNVAAMGIGIPALILSFALTSLPPEVILFGFRASFLHFPLIFLISRVFDREDVTKVGLFWLLASLPMSLIVFNQFSHPVNHAWNVTPGGGEAMKGALDRARATGTFSFSTGMSSFVGLLTAFLFIGIFEKGRYPLWILSCAALAVGSILIFCASRSILLQFLFVASCAGAAACFKPRFLPALAGVVLVAGLLWLAIRDADSVRQGVETHETRFAAAAHVEGSTFARVYSGYIPPIHLFLEGNLTGEGLGLGTNAGAAFLYGAPMFLISEGEIGRAVGEMGAPLGAAYIALRWGLVAWMGILCWKRLRAGDPLPLLLFGVAHHEVMKGQWGIATSLGFGVVTAGLCLASMNEPLSEDDESGSEDADVPESGDPQEEAA